MERSNMSDAFKLQQNMMTWSGVWPIKNSSLFFTLRKAMSWICGIGLTTIMAVEVFYVYNDFTKLSEVVYLMVTMSTYLLKLFAFIHNKEKFLAVVGSLKTPIFYSYEPDLDIYMKQTIKISTLIANLYRYSCVAVVLLYGGYPVLDNKDLPSPFPYNLGQYRIVMYIFQSMSLGFSAWNNSCLDTLCTSLMGLAATQFRILEHKLMRIKEESILKAVQGHSSRNIEVTEGCKVTDEMIKQKLKNCVEHHVAILTYVKGVEQVFSFGLLFQFLGSIIVICNTMFHTILISMVSIQFALLAIYFIVMLTQLSMYCWYGNEIIWNSTNLIQACYLSKWYGCGNDVKKYLFIIMERSKRPVSITALKFTRISLIAFMSVIQWSYSYFALLMKMYDKTSKTAE